MTASARLTSPGSMVGTVAYMSPEQLAGLPVDSRSDLFSMGLLLYEMATGRPAFDGVTTALLSASILHEEPSRPSVYRPDLPEPIEAVILKALEKDRDLRCQSAAEVRADLGRISRAFAAGAATSGPTHPVPVPPSSTITQPAAVPGRSLWLLSAVVIVTAGGLVISWIASGNRRSTRAAGGEARNDAPSDHARCRIDDGAGNEPRRAVDRLRVRPGWGTTRPLGAAGRRWRTASDHPTCGRRLRPGVFS